MKCQNIFSMNDEKNIHLSSALFAYSVLKIKLKGVIKGMRTGRSRSN